MFHTFIANSALMLNLMHSLDDVALSSFPALIFGERGVGKELIAEQIHLKGSNRDFPFVRIRCMNASPDIVDAGSLKEGSTLFLDEVSLLDASQQSHLIYLIQEKKFPSTMRIIASSCGNLEGLVESGAFNKTLFSYLNILPITVPALRHHSDDIDALAQYFLRKHSGDMNKAVTGISSAAMKILKKHYWPGNVRELGNVMEHAVMMCRGTCLGVEDFPLLKTESDFVSETLEEKDRTLKAALDRFKKAYITGLLDENGWNKSAVARILDVQRTYIFRLMKELDISPD